MEPVLPTESGDLIVFKGKLPGVMGESVSDEDPVELSLFTGTLTGIASGTLLGRT